MNKIPLYQHPFVDVFKSFKLTEWKQAEKSGEVTEGIDRCIGKKVLQLVGPSNTATFVQIPRTKSSLKSLGLIGKFVYVEALGSGTRPFSLHLDYIVDEKQVTRLSFSNLFKSEKTVNTTNVQIPLQLPEQWSIICIHVIDLMEAHKVFLPSGKREIVMRSLQICGNITLRGIFTSDIQYSIRTLPKEMAFKLPKDVDWYSVYRWVDIPQSAVEDTKVAPASEVNKENNKKLSNAKKPVETVSEKKEKAPERSLPPPPQEEEEKEKADFFDPEQVQKEEVPEITPKASGAEEEKEVGPQVPAKHVRRNPKEPFRIVPDPMFRLKKLLGISLRASPSVLFAQNPKHCDEICFGCGSALVHMNCETSAQRFSSILSSSAAPGFHEIPPLIGIAASRNLLLTLDEKQALTLWSNDLDTTFIMTFTPQLQQVKAIGISREEKFLGLAGKDQYKRDMILVYDLQLLTRQKKIEIVAKQLSDFEVVSLSWNPDLDNAFVTCGNENVRFWKTKNGSIPGKAAIFQQPLRGKNFIGVSYIKDEGDAYTHALAATECGTVFKIKVSTRTVEQITRGTEPISLFKTFSTTVQGVSGTYWGSATDKKFRLWDSGRNVQVLEHEMEGKILSAGFNLYGDKIVIADALGNVGVLKLKLKTYEILVRSHTDHLLDFEFSKPCNALVTGGKDNTVRVWSLSELIQVAEFVVPQDQLTGLACHPSAPYCACIFASGFVRLFDLSTSQLVPACGISAKISPDILSLVRYSADGDTLAVMDARGKIMLLDSRDNRYEPFKTIESDAINPNYVHMCFSPDGELFAHIGSNANVVCIWETTNYSLKYRLDLPGEVIAKVAFSTNCKDLLLLTATSKLKYFRLNDKQLKCQQIMEVPGLHDLECTDFCISQNNALVVTCGKDGIIKAFDYAMRGDVFPAFQAFLGHQTVPSKVQLTDVGSGSAYLVSISRESNFVYVWDSFVNSPSVDIPRDIMEISKKDLAGKSAKEEPEESLVPMQAPPQAYPHPGTEAKLLINKEEAGIEEPTPVPEAGIKPITCEEIDIHRDEISLANKRLVSEYVVGFNGLTQDNVAWEKGKWLVYTSTNKAIIESMEGTGPDSRRQMHISCGADKVDGISISPNHKLIAAFTHHAIYTGSTSVYIIGTEKWNTIAHISISQPSISSVAFSPNNNVLLILSSSNDTSESMLHFYDPISPELLLRSALPYPLTAALWNPFSASELEFVVMSGAKYEFWMLTPELNLQYQEGKLLAANAALSSFTFSEPIIGLASILLAIAKENGSVDIIDTRTNSPTATAQLSPVGIKLMSWKQQRLIYATRESGIFSVPIDSQDKGTNMAGIVEAFKKSDSILLDGPPTSLFFDEKGNEGMVGTAAGTVWFIDWIEHLSIRVCLGHAADSEAKFVKWKSYLTSAEGPPRRLLVSATSDQTLKVWNSETYDQLLKIAIPKEECLALAFHPFRQMCVCSFSDGYIRFFDLMTAKNMGRCLVNENDQVLDMAFFPNGTHILTASKAGLLDLISIEKFEPLSIKMSTVLNSRASLSTLRISSIEPYAKIMLCTLNGKMSVVNRRKLTSANYEAFTLEEVPKFVLMDTFNLADYENNGFSETKTADKSLNAYYGAPSGAPAGNKALATGREVMGDFAYTETGVVICAQKRSMHVFIRNYVMHQVIKRVSFDSPLLTLDVNCSRPHILVATENNRLKVVDYADESGNESLELACDSYHAFQSAVFCAHGMVAAIAGPELIICLIKGKSEL